MKKDRVPSGQTVVKSWPVLHAGGVPVFDRASWRFRLWGLCQREVTLDYDQLRAIPTTEATADFHCVTTWTRLDNRWIGLRMRDLFAQASPLPEAKYVLFHCEENFTANASMEDCLRDDALLAWGLDGKELTPDHGFPLRVVLPHLYAWKSAKWVRGVEFLAQDQPGYWEQRGYHMRGDPWKEERYRED